MEQPLVTVYTQAYNSEKYIRQCIESVLEQNYKNFEYFLCNHGSSDKTLEIMKEYAKRDDRIKIVDMPNSARGFYPDYIKEHGKGKYFAMLDSDDYWTADNLEKLVFYAEEKECDMVICGINSLDNETGEVEIERQVAQDFLFETNENEEYFSRIYDFLRTAWGRIIRMDIVRRADYSIYKINAKAMIADDTAFTLANYAKCKRIGFIPDILLYWRIGRSASVTGRYKPEMLENHIHIFTLSDTILEELKDNSAESFGFILAVYWGSVYDSFAQLFSSEDISAEEKRSEIERFLQIEFVKTLMQEVETVDREVLEMILEGYEQIKGKED